MVIVECVTVSEPGLSIQMPPPTPSFGSPLLASVSPPWIVTPLITGDPTEISITRWTPPWMIDVVRAPAPVSEMSAVNSSWPSDSVYVPAGRLITLEPPTASASCTAARSEHWLRESAQMPSPVKLSTVSAVVLTVKTWVVSAADCAPPTSSAASTVAAAIGPTNRRMPRSN